MPAMSSHNELSKGQTAAASPPHSARDFFSELGVRTFINAAGTYTLLGASLMLPAVVEAISYASQHFVEINELQEAAGKRLAELIGCEAAMVTSGAAAALTIGTAACITGDNPQYIRQIPDLAGLKSEVIIQRSHRFLYDHAIRNCGVRFVEIETVAELENVISDDTAMMLFVNDNEPKGKIKCEEFVALGTKHRIPTFNDAAADVPPTENLSKYTTMGFDLVSFSGGKGMHGPQNAGLLLGRKDLIRAAKLNSAPNGDSIGRGFKLSKETILGLLVAVEIYLKRDEEAEAKEWERRINLLADSVANMKALNVEIFTPPIANHVPHMKVTWNQAALKVSADHIRQQLREGSLSIEAIPTYSYEPAGQGEEIRFGVWMMQPGEAEIVAQRLREVFGVAALIPLGGENNG
jgi:D-glucosaminate-6-phosphate ammonia-lyase